MDTGTSRLRAGLTLCAAALVAAALIATPATPAAGAPAAGAPAAGVFANAGARTAEAEIPPVPAATGTTYHVDCAATAAGTGSSSSPWNSVAQVNAKTLQPGDHVLFKRGTTCNGALAPRGSGAAGDPIVIEQYGSGATKPMIAGRGVPATVTLDNQQYWEIRNLQITNVDPDPADRYTERRRGLVVRLHDFGKGTYYRLIGLDVHDVYGDKTKNVGGSGGIQLEVDASTVASEQKVTWFDQVLISTNHVTNVNRSGITTSSQWRCRSSAGCTAGSALPWHPSTNLTITDNIVDGTGGDGIVTAVTTGAVVEHNTITSAAERDENGPNAALWPFNSDNTLFQYNDVSGTHKTAKNSDGTAFDIDFGTSGTIFQYNYSHDNDGGMILFCGCKDGASSANGIVRYNVSEGDHLRVVSVAGATNHEFYNNTIVLPADEHVALTDVSDRGGTVTFANNLFLASTWVTDDSNTYPSVTDFTWSHNAFTGPGGTWPTDNDPVIISTALPLAPGTGLDRFRVDDSRLADQGTPIAGAGVDDLYGNSVPTSAPPDIGVYQFS